MKNDDPKDTKAQREQKAKERKIFDDGIFKIIQDFHANCYKQPKKS